MHRACCCLVALVFVAIACGSEPIDVPTPDVSDTGGEVDASVDASVDDADEPVTDAAPDASRDVGTGEPIADAGPDRSVDVGDEVTLDGTASSAPDGSPLNYQWTFEQNPQGSSASFSDAATARPTFVADVAGDYIIALVVSDGEHDSEKDTVIVSAGGGVNQPPVADAGEDLAGRAGTEVVLDGRASSDPDSAELSYQWRFISQPADSDVEIRDATSPVARFRPSHGGTYEIELDVSDGDKADTDGVSVMVEATVSSSCLMISEYIEGSAYNKAVELHNCAGHSIDLSNFGFCVVANENTSCTNYDIELTETLAAGEVFTLCHNRLDEAVLDPDSCDMTHGSVNFNGDDRLIVYEDLDDSGDFSEADMPADVFGEVTNQPSSTSTWSDVTLRRCDFDRLDGQTGFDYSAYFAEADEVDDFSDLGTPPQEGCDE